MTQAAHIWKIRDTSRTIIMSDEGTHGGPNSVNVVMESINEYDYSAPQDRALSSHVQYVTTTLHGGATISRTVSPVCPNDSSLETEGRIRHIKVQLPTVYEELTDNGWRKKNAR